MRYRVVQVVVLSSAIALTFAAARQPVVPTRLIVHEWGTFTSIAGADGQAAQWLPQTGKIDLPCFVERSPIQVKAEIPGTVRMETPVLYFYSSRALDASVHVEFPHGLLTEWYPHADVTSRTSTIASFSGTIDWPRLSVRPDRGDAFPVEPGTSRYYAARHATANPIFVGSQAEKFLFYRGVGQFQPPVAAIAREDGSVAVRNVHGAPLGDLILFENRSGAMAFGVHHLASASAVLPRASLDDASGPPAAELKRMLMANGLYDREAQAMLDTWNNSWFEEGARLLYIVSRADVDEILPLMVSPRPSSIARVFVGRIELVTPATIRDVRAAIESGDRALLAKYGRFLQPIAERAGLAGKIPVSALPPASPAPCR